MKDTETGDLFYHPPNIKGMVRRADHSTSVSAAVGVVKRDKSKLQAEVLAAFHELGPMTDGELEALPRFSQYAYSTVRKRRTELYQNGDLVDTGERRISVPSHSAMKVWRLK